MTSWGLRILAGFCLIPPLTPIGIWLWYVARKRDKKAKSEGQQAEDLAAIRQELEQRDGGDGR